MKVLEVQGENKPGAVWGRNIKEKATFIIFLNIPSNRINKYVEKVEEEECQAGFYSAYILLWFLSVDSSTILHTTDTVESWRYDDSLFRQYRKRNPSRDPATTVTAVAIIQNESTKTCTKLSYLVSSWERYIYNRHQVKLNNEINNMNSYTHSHTQLNFFII